MENYELSNAFTPASDLQYRTKFAHLSIVLRRERKITLVGNISYGNRSHPYTHVRGNAFFPVYILKRRLVQDLKPFVKTISFLLNDFSIHMENPGRISVKQICGAVYIIR